MYGGEQNNPDSVVICPYDPRHRVSRSRFPKHLIKCEEKYPPNYLEICPYSASHRFKKEEMEKHVLSCPMKKIVNLQYQQHKVCSNIYEGLRTMKMRTTIDLIEPWSDDEDVDSGFESTPSKSPTQSETNQSTVANTDYSNDQLRAPHGYAQVMMMESDIENCEDDDNVSVKSYMAMGRGKSLISNYFKEQLRKLGRGRGRLINVP